jgi:hypothetical protein
MTPTDDGKFAHCEACGVNMMVPIGERRVHFAKPDDVNPCPGSWPSFVRPRAKA